MQFIRSQARPLFLMTYGAFLVILCLFVFHTILQSRAVPTAGPPVFDAPSLKGKKAPDIAIGSFAARWATRKRQRPVVLEVIATWCENCKANVEALNDLFKAYGDRCRFVAVTGSNIASDGKSRESDADVTRYVKENRVLVSTYFDATRSVARNYSVTGFPAFVIIRGDGIITYNSIGRASKEDLEDQIRAVL